MEYNFITTVTPLDATDTITFQGVSVQTANDARAATTVTYYDGLGRPTQTHHVKASPLGGDLVNLTEYDGLDNVSKQWKAIPTFAGNGTYMNPDLISSSACLIYDDDMPYTSTLYESSSLHRVNAYQRAGEAWDGIRQTIRYRLNDTNEVLRFEVLNDSTLTCKGYYDAAQLEKVVHRDEDGKQITTYTDKHGRVVLEQVGPDTYTYYVYNFLGQLAYVLPPALAWRLTSGNYTDSHEGLRQYAYVYKYDERGNCVSKRLPGCEPLYMVHDKGGRLVQTQDGNQRARGDYWTVCMYDEWNRIAYTAEILTGHRNLQEAIAYCKDKSLLTSFATLNFCPIGNTGYSSFYYRNKPAKLLTVNYYDSYEFLTLLPDSMETALSYSTLNDYGIAVLDTAQLHGRLTGTRTYNLNDNNYVVTVNYYDIDGRLVQQRSTNQLGGMDNTYLALDFTGNILQQLTTHSTANDISVTEHYTYTYDGMNRPVQTIYQHNDDDPMVLRELQYDNIGRLQKKRIYNAIDSIQYQYNIQDWVTQIKSSGFEENIYYNQPLNISPASTKLYNGNISATTWTYQGKTNGYMYFYDNKNRFDLCYSILDSTFGDYYYSENMTYDRSGNITRLERWDERDAMNLLHYTYDGNQVTKVTDEGYYPVDYSCKRYVDLADEDIEMGYDANGNLIYDLDR